MHHLAIMKKSWGLLPKILDGSKTIESRWYKNKSTPWGKINSGDILYFKNSGEPVTIKTQVSNVLQFDNLTQSEIYKLRKKYAKEIGLSNSDLDGFKDFFEGKRYGILVFLENPQKIKSFQIDKSGFGTGAAWLVVENISQIKLT